MAWSNTAVPWTGRTTGARGRRCGEPRVKLFKAEEIYDMDRVDVADMAKNLSSQYGLKAQEHIDPRGIKITNDPMR